MSPNHPAVVHYDDASERALHACILLEPAALDEVIDILAPGDFHGDAARRTWEAMAHMHARHVPIGLETLRAEMLARGDLERVESYLLALTETVPIVEHVEHHAKRIRGHAQVRAVLDAATRIQVRAAQPIDDPSAFAAEAEAMMARAARERATAAGPVDMKGCVIETVDRLTRQSEGDVAEAPIATRFATLNGKLGGGFRPGELILVAGRPGHGKTAIALDMALSMAEHGPGILYELEMSRDELTRRALASHGRIDGGRMRTLALTGEDWTRLTNAGGALASLPLHIDDTPAATIAHIRATARRQKARDGLRWLMIDYLQLMRPLERVGSREVEIGDISRGLKALAKELEVPIIALAQLNRDLEKRAAKDRRPMLSDLRDSGSLEQDADAVMFVFREELYRRDDPELRGVGELVIGKQRSGPIGSVMLRYTAEFTRFDELEADRFGDRYEAPPPDDFDDEAW